MSQTPAEQDTHWLLRRTTIRRLRWGMYAVLALTVIAQLFVPVEAKFGIDGWLAFPAVYGFVSCVAMVVVAKLLGIWLKRKDTYYDD